MTSTSRSIGHWQAPIQQKALRQPRLRLVSIHSFTPVYRKQPRAWHVGILAAQDRRLADPCWLPCAPSASFMLETTSRMLRRTACITRWAGTARPASALGAHRAAGGPDRGCSPHSDRWAESTSTSTGSHSLMRAVPVDSTPPSPPGSQRTLAHAMNKPADATRERAIEIRFGQVGLVQVRLLTTDPGAILDELTGRTATAPNFFERTAVCLDLGALAGIPTSPSCAR